MNLLMRFRTSRLSVALLISAAILLLAACQPIVDPALLEAEDSAQQERETTETVPGVEPAQATINARSLGVREGPAEAYDLLTGVEEGAKYLVLAMTSDGAWLQLEIEDTPDGQGWVSTEFVTLEGDITNIPTVPAEETVAEEPEAEGTADEELVEEAPMAPPVDSIGQVTIDSVDLPLRVRSAPTTEEENKIGNVFHNETYEVLEISDDGTWVKIWAPELSEDGGWITTAFATFEGAVADLVVVEEPEEEAPTDAAEEAVADEAAEEEVAEDAATDEATEEVAEETTEEATEDVVEEEAQEAVAEETAEEVSAEPTEEAAAEAETGMADEEAAVVPGPFEPGDVVFIETPLPLRVRSEPTTEEDNKIGSVYNWDEKTVIEVSEDGLWLKIEVPELSEDGGWISAEYATVIE